MSERPRAPEAAAAAALAAAVAAFLAPFWLRGLSPFWGDLTYLHQAWRSSPAQLVQAGRAPLWEPSLYLGMPMAASMQGGLFYPPTILYYCFGFAGATAAFHALHYFLCGWLAALWLRSLRVAWGPAAGAGAALALSGLLVSRVHFLNHLATLAWAPALALLFRRRAALAAALALMFLAGYPTFIPGAALAAWAVALALRRRGTPGPASWAADWAVAAAAAAALSAAQLLPALELAALSRRSGGVDAAEAVTWSFRVTDLRQWLSPLLVPLSSFRPAVDWWKCVYLGLAASAAVVLGAAGLPRRRAAALAAVLAAVALLILGDSTTLSARLWSALPPLRFVRYPGNLAYLALLPLTALIAAGFARRPLLAAVAAAELVACAWLSTPAAPRGLFVEAGPLVRSLQESLGQTRYLISPRALEASTGAGVVDWKTRLYGLTNAHYRLRAAANFGEPLVPAGSYAFMDRVLSAPGADQAAGWMAWAGASRLLSPEAPASPRLVSEGRRLWEVSRLKRPTALARWLTPEAGAALPEGLPPSPPEDAGRLLSVSREREDRYSVSGEGRGWVYVAEPRYPGWRAELETAEGVRPARTLPALGAFQKAEVPDGPWTLRFRYRSTWWALGVALSLAAWAAAARVALRADMIDSRPT